MFPTLNANLLSPRSLNANNRPETLKFRQKQGGDYYVSKSKTNKKKENHLRKFISTGLLVASTAFIAIKHHDKIKKVTDNHKIDKKSLKYHLDIVGHYTKEVFKDLFGFFKNQSKKAKANASENISKMKSVIVK